MINFLKRFNLFEVLLVAVILFIHLHAAQADAYTFPNIWFKRDDAYYYFKVAQNISEGHGSTFDGINPTNGYHPLWLAVCIPIFALARFDVILPLRVLVMVIAAMQAWTAVLLYRLIKKHLSQAVAILAASFWAFEDYTHATVYELGLETPLAALSVVFLFYKLSQFELEWRARDIAKRDLAWLGFLAAIVMFSRLDLVFLAVIVGIWLVFRGNPIRHLLPLDIVLIFISMTSSVILRTGFESYNTLYAGSAIEAAILALLVKIPLLYFFGAYQHPRARSLWAQFRGLFLALSASAVLVAGIYILLVQIGIGRNFPRSAFLLDFGISLALLFPLRLAASWFADPSRVNAESPLAQFKLHWRKWLSEGLAFYGVLGGLLVFYMLFNQFAFGTSSPVSGQIKRWWGGMASVIYESPASSWTSYFGIDSEISDVSKPFSELFWWGADALRPIFPGADKQDERYYAAMFAVLLTGTVLVFAAKKRSLRVITNMGFVPLAAGGAIHLLSYTATAYGGAKAWYWVSQMVLLTLTFSFLLDLILKPLQKIKIARISLEIAALLIGVLLAQRLNQFIQYAMRHDYFAPDRAYMEVVEYLEENTPPGSVVGMTGGGNVGYFINDRTIVNMDGLINSYDYFQALQNGDAPTYLYDQGMTIVFANPRLLALPPYFGQFAPYFERYSSYGGKDLLYLLEEPKY